VDTPDWIKTLLERNSRGWFFPITMSAEHPLVVEGWQCFGCDEPIRATDVAFVMPFHGGPGDDRWIASHRECIANQLFKDPLTKAALRPSNYATLSAEEQWAVDKRLGILDWDGT